MPVRTRGRGAASPAWKLLKLALIGWFLTAEVGCCDLDRATLLQYQHAGTLAWDTAGSTAAWEDAGVRCEEGRAYRITLPEGMSLPGPLPAVFSKLTALNRFAASDNGITGSLPPEWSACVELRELNLDGNRLSGTLPEDYSALSALEELHLEGNTLTGPLPLGWSGLERLEELSLGGNALRGPLPAAWSELRELEELKLAGNGLGGTLPAQWSAMRLLESLDLGGNNLTGGIPEEWGVALTVLESLTLGEAQELSCIPPSLLRALTSGTYPWLIQDRIVVCGMPQLKPPGIHTSPWLQLVVTVIAPHAGSASAAAATTGRRSLQQLDRADLMALSPATREAVELLREDVVELTGLPRVAVAAWSVQEAGGGLEAGGALTMVSLLSFPPGATYDELEDMENRLATSKDEFTRLRGSGLQVVHISAEESLPSTDDDSPDDDFGLGLPPRSDADAAESGSVALIVGATVGAVAVALAAIAGLSFYMCCRVSKQQALALGSSTSSGQDASSPDAAARVKGSEGHSDGESPAGLKKGVAVRGSLSFKQQLSASVARVGEPAPGKFFDLSVDWGRELEGQLGAKLGTGAFGTVYKARWRGQDVAVKVLTAGVNMDSDAQMVSFRDEVEIMAELSNKGCDRIVRMYGACLTPPKVCIIYEYMPGGSLHNRIHNSSQPLTHLDVMRIGLDIAEGLAFMHATTVHRDLKPQNILLGADGRAKICDLGLGRAKDPMKSYLITEAGGTASYMAPEVFSQCKLHDKVDMYALGVILNEMLSRKPPWSNNSWHVAAFQIMYAVTVHKERPEIPKSCPPALATLIRRCWATDSKERPSAAEAVEQLGGLLAAAEAGQAAQAATGMLGAAVLTA